MNTEETAKEIIRLYSFGIPKGLGKPNPGEMCIEAIVSHALGLEPSDKPYSCIASFVARPTIILNDCNWSSNKARADGMLALGLAQLGSNKLKENEFNDRLKLLSTKRILPYLIQKHYDNKKDEKLLIYKKQFEELVELDDSLWNEFYSYYSHYYDYNYDYYYNYYNYYYYYDYSYFGDEFFLLIADTILQTLKDLNCEGCKYLHLIGK